MMPGETSEAPEPEATPQAAAPLEPAHRQGYHWYHKMSAVLFITFCLEIGLFLLIFPWTEYWDGNYFSAFIPEWHRYWDNLYVRGAISGLGIVNLYISFVEIFRLRRFARR